MFKDRSYCVQNAVSEKKHCLKVCVTYNSQILILEIFWVERKAQTV